MHTVLFTQYIWFNKDKLFYSNTEKQEQASINNFAIHSNAFPSSLYVVRKGFQVVHIKAPRDYFVVEIVEGKIAHI